MPSSVETDPVHFVATAGMSAGETVTLGEIQRSLARMEARTERLTDDHELRLRRLERWIYMLPPAIITAGASVIVAIVRGGP